MSDNAKRDLTRILVERIEEMLTSGEYRPGDKLPAERDLAKQFSVNRASVRQALKALEIAGVVVQKIGNGTYFAKDGEAVLESALRFLYLLDGHSSEFVEQRLRLAIEQNALRFDTRTIPPDSERAMVTSAGCA